MRILIKYLVGYYVLYIYGDNVERLLNICKNHNIEFDNISYKDKKYKCKLKAKYYKDLITLNKKTNVNIDVLKRVGIKYFFDRYRKRKIFILCMLLAITALFYSTLFVWNIEIKCDGVYTDVQIKKYLEDNGISLGKKVKNISCSELESNLRENFPKIAWISCDIKGTTLNVVFTETVSDEMIDSPKKPCDIVAVKNAVVTKTIVHNGIVIARKGDEVKTNDILITGVVNVTNEYDEQIETDYVCAKGLVYGKVKYIYEDSFPLRNYEKEYTNNHNKEYKLFAFGNIINIPKLKNNKYELYDEICTTNQLKISSNTYLPLAIIFKNNKEYRLVEKIYTEEEANKIAKDRLQVYLDDLRKKGVVILENNVKIEIKDGKVIAKGKIICEELIGVPSEINIINQGES